jgi:hypothetical protein
LNLVRFVGIGLLALAAVGATSVVPDQNSTAFAANPVLPWNPQIIGTTANEPGPGFASNNSFFVLTKDLVGSGATIVRIDLRHGSERVVGAGRVVCASADGERILSIGGSPADYTLWNLVTGVSTAVHANAVATIVEESEGVRCSADLSRIVFKTGSGEGVQQLWLYHATGGSLTEITPSEPMGFFMPQYLHPDGSYVIVRSQPSTLSLSSPNPPPVGLRRASRSI